MKEVPHPAHDHHCRLRLERLRPGEHAFRIDHFVGIALHDQPGASGAERPEKSNRPTGGATVIEPRRVAARRQPQRHVRPERESRQYQPTPRPSRCAARGDGRASSVSPLPSSIRSGACAHAAKIEAQRRDAGALQRAGDGGDDLVVHGAAEQGVRMAHDRIASRRRPGRVRIFSTSALELGARGTVDRHALSRAPLEITRSPRARRRRPMWRPAESRRPAPLSP